MMVMMMVWLGWRETPHLTSFQPSEHILIVRYVPQQVPEKKRDERVKETVTI